MKRKSRRAFFGILILLIFIGCGLGTVIKGVITNDYEYPIAGATVVLHSDVQTTTTDEDGY